MKVIEPGHVYELENIDGSGTQTIAFVRRRDEHGEPLPATERRPGLLTQDVLRVALDRTLYLYAEDVCDEDTVIVAALRKALTAYESRAARRTIEKLAKPEKADLCPKCRHILCRCRAGGSA